MFQTTPHDQRLASWPRLMPTDGLPSALQQLNLERRVATATATPSAIEDLIEQLFGASKHLIVHGTALPENNAHDHLPCASGTWHRGVIHGAVGNTTDGLPGFRWRPDGDGVPAWLLVSDGLPACWPQLDAFEGPTYRRILAPIWDHNGLLAVGNTYEAIDLVDAVA